MTQNLEESPTLSTLGRVGLWLALPMAALQALNVYRVSADPIGFAEYMGAPLAAGDGAAWVQIYAFRAAFIALMVGALVLRRDVATLKWVALVALVMPIGDAWLVWSLGAEPAILGRHIATAVYVFIVFAVLAAAERRGAR